MILFDLTERQERAATYALLFYIIETTMPDGDEFDTMFMSAGEAASRCLSKVDIADGHNGVVRLKLPRSDIPAKLDQRNLSELPYIEDVLDVAFCVANQYDICPHGMKNLAEKVDFSPSLLRILTDLSLIDAGRHPAQEFVPFLLAHYFLVVERGNFDTDAMMVLDEMSRKTWRDAPDDFRRKFVERKDRWLSWCCGYLDESWRLGHWIHRSQKPRLIPGGYNRLYSLVPEWIATEIWSDIAAGRL